jgi:hypothetical protein
MEDAKTLADLMPEKDERIASARAELKTALETHDPELAKAFNEMTPEQKRAGRLVSALVEGAAKGNVGIEDAFTWWEQEHNSGEKLDNFNKCLFLFMAVENGCDPRSDETYRGVRKIAVTMLMDG